MYCILNRIHPGITSISIGALKRHPYLSLKGEQKGVYYDCEDFQENGIVLYNGECAMTNDKIFLVEGFVWGLLLLI